MQSSMMIREERGEEGEGSLVLFGDQLLPGFLFQPTDVDILDQYLRSRLMSGTSATVSSCLIREFDVYSTEPWNLPCDSFGYQNEEKAMHFFTPRHPTSSKSRRASRTAGCGFWRGSGRDNNIMDGSRLIGHKTQLTFMILKGEGNERKIKTDWIMHEFRLHSPSNNTEEFDCMVLCRIYKKRSNNGCSREGEEEEAKQRLAMADQNNKTVTCEERYVPLLSASSSLSKIHQYVSREEEPECLSTPSASTNAAASVVAAVAEQGEEEAEAAQETRVKRRLLEEYPEPPSVLWEEPEGLAPFSVDEFDFENLCSPTELFGHFPSGT